jgi:capsular polysaccharide biosynthesis protein
MIFTVVAGLAVGLIISALALSALTALDKTARRQEDIEGVAGMEVVASIRELPRRGRFAGLRKVES